MSATDVRELTIQYFSEEEHRLSAESRSYRLALQAALDALHDVTLENDTLKTRIDQLVISNNALVERLAIATEAD